MAGDGYARIRDEFAKIANLGVFWRADGAFGVKDGDSIDDDYAKSVIGCATSPRQYAKSAIPCAKVVDEYAMVVDEVRQLDDEDAFVALGARSTSDEGASVRDDRAIAARRFATTDDRVANVDPSTWSVYERRGHEPEQGCALGHLSATCCGKAARRAGTRTFACRAFTDRLDFRFEYWRKCGRA